MCLVNYKALFCLSPGTFKSGLDSCTSIPMGLPASSSPGPSSFPAEHHRGLHETWIRSVPFSSNLSLLGGSSPASLSAGLRPSSCFSTLLPLLKPFLLPGMSFPLPRVLIPLDLPLPLALPGPQVHLATLGALASHLCATAPPQLSLSPYLFAQVPPWGWLGIEKSAFS